MKNKSLDLKHVEIKIEERMSEDEGREQQSSHPVSFEHIEVKEETLNFEEIEELSDDQDKQDSFLEEVNETNHCDRSPYVSESHRMTKRRRTCPTYDVRPATRKGKYQVFGKYLAKKLEDLPSEMAIYAQKFIGDVLFEAEMGTLSRTSKIAVSEPI